MRATILLAIAATVPLSGAALKPINGDLRPSDSKSVAVFKTTPEGELKITLFFPKDWKPSDRRPGIVFFFGGGFVGGSPAQFTTKAEYLASRGMVAASAEYRVKNRHQTGPEKSIEDAKSAIRWMRLNAPRLGIDPNRLLAGGGSAGGTCATFAAYNTTYEPDGEDTAVSSKPNALVLYNPALGFGSEIPANNKARSKEEQEKMSRFLLAWNVTKGGPPAILFFGTDDALLPPARMFVQRMIAAGNRVELYTAAGQKHGFFNDREGTPWHAACLRQTDLFLASLGYLKGQPAIARPANAELKNETTLLAAQDPSRMAEIQAKMRRNEALTPEEQAFVKRMREIQQQRNAEFAKNNPPRDSTGMIPLPDLGKETYKGEQGGLYPGGENVAPAAHAKAGLKITLSIKPLDADGRESNEGRIVMISTGMSNTTMESQVFAKLVKEASGVNPKFQFVDCAQGGQTTTVTARPDATYWKVAEQRLTDAGVTPKQAQVAWIKEADALPSAPFPEEVKKMQAELTATLHNLHDKYPNIKIAYLSSRIYAGYATSALNPEPHAYEEGFAVKWVIADQIAGNQALNYDPVKGAVRSPWIAWGPYLWADGVKPRSDGLTWVKEDMVEQDRTHPSQSGGEKVAKLLLEFLKKDPTSTPWFLR